MTVEQHNIVDFIHVEPEGSAVLTVSDHLLWDDVNEHLYCLQEKLNTYLAFIESGEIYSKWPKAVGHPIRIDVVMQFPAPECASWFFVETAIAIEAAGFKFSTRVR
jgi:hypothetical protein